MGLVKRTIGSLWLKANGWTIEIAEPLPKKFVFIAAPHTSNWDFVYMMATAWVLDMRIHWLGKHSLFEFPMGILARALGGIPVDRRSPQNIVAQVADRFAASDDLMLAIPAEGTRKKVEYWKSGFYQIARQAGVPIAPGFLDFRRRVAGFGHTFHPSGDLVRDMDRLRAFYADKRGRYPELESIPRLREEAPATGGAVSEGASEPREPDGHANAEP